jgi:hypothetical protein
MVHIVSFTMCLCTYTGCQKELFRLAIAKTYLIIHFFWIGEIIRLSTGLKKCNIRHKAPGMLFPWMDLMNWYRTGGFGFLTRAELLRAKPEAVQSVYSAWFQLHPNGCSETTTTKAGEPHYCSWHVFFPAAVWFVHLHLLLMLQTIVEWKLAALIGFHTTSVEIAR